MTPNKVQKRLIPVPPPRGCEDHSTQQESNGPVAQCATDVSSQCCYWLLFSE